MGKPKENSTLRTAKTLKMFGYFSYMFSYAWHVRDKYIAVKNTVLSKPWMIS